MSRVECHSGVEYGERPRRFEWQGEYYEIVEILDRWRTPEGRHFRVITARGQGFELFLDEISSEWQITEL